MLSYQGKEGRRKKGDPGQVVNGQATQKAGVEPKKKKKTQVKDVLSVVQSVCRGGGGNTYRKRPSHRNR